MTEPTDAEILELASQYWHCLDETESATEIELVRAALAKWGQPAHAAEPFGYVNTYTGQFYKDVEPCRKNNEGHWRTVFTSQQPTQTQPVAREPLSHAQAKALVLKYGNDPLNLVFQVELAHGIKGGQHGTDT